MLDRWTTTFNKKCSRHHQRKRRHLPSFIELVAQWSRKKISPFAGWNISEAFCEGVAGYLQTGYLWMGNEIITWKMKLSIDLLWLHTQRIMPVIGSFGVLAHHLHWPPGSGRRWQWWTPFRGKRTSGTCVGQSAAPLGSPGHLSTGCEREDGTSASSAGKSAKSKLPS